MTPQKRNKINQKLPSGWRYRLGAYRYRVPKNARHLWDDKSEFTLGKTLAEAHETFARRIGYEGSLNTISQLCERYALEVIPEKAKATQRSNRYSIERIRKAFADNAIAAIQPKHIYAYRDHTAKTESKKKANLDLEVLSHMFTKSIEWGARNDHPMTNKKVVKYTLETRKVSATKDDVLAFAETLPRKWQLYIALKIWTGRRKGELLRLKRQDLTAEGMAFTNNKAPYDQFVIAWEQETRDIVNELLQLPQGISSVYLFHTRTGQAYISEDGETSGFDSTWQRAMKKALASGAVKTRFTEHDLRKYRASDLQADQAQKLLRHTNAKQTKTYRLKPDLVKV